MNKFIQIGAEKDEGGVLKIFYSVRRRNTVLSKLDGLGKHTSEIMRFVQTNANVNLIASSLTGKVPCKAKALLKRIEASPDYAEHLELANQGMMLLSPRDDNHMRFMMLYAKAKAYLALRLYRSCSQVLSHVLMHDTLKPLIKFKLLELQCLCRKGLNDFGGAIDFHKQAKAVLKEASLDPHCQQELMTDLNMKIMKLRQEHPQVLEVIKSADMMEFHDDDRIVALELNDRPEVTSNQACFKLLQDMP